MKSKEEKDRFHLHSENEDEKWESVRNIHRHIDTEDKIYQ